MSNGVLLKYKGVAIGSDESFRVDDESTPPAPFVDYAQMFSDSSNIPNYGNPCEPYSVVLEGLSVPIPDEPEKAQMRYWSNELNGDISTVNFQIVADALFSSAGISINFETVRDIFPTTVGISWYRDDTLIATQLFRPTSARAFFDQKVEMYNRVQIVLFNLNMPRHRFRIESISFGLNTEFTGKDLKNTKISQQIDPVSAKIPINTCNFTVISDNIDFVFEQRQPIEIYFNDKLVGLTFIKNSAQKNAQVYDVQCEDYIGVLEGATFKGGMYNRQKASAIVSDICSIAGVPIDIAPELENVLLTGHIAYGSCRSALQQVLIASNGVTDTSGTTLLRIKILKNSLTQTIPPERRKQGVNVSEETKMTEVRITQHSFTPIFEETTVYEADRSGTGENIEIVFSEPLHSLSITKGKIIEQGVNYAIINANAGCVLKGKKFSHTTSVKSRKNPNVLRTDKENVFSITNATLISTDNVDKVLDVCYNRYVKNKTVRAKIVEGRNADGSFEQPVNLGDLIEIETPFAGKLRCVAESQSFHLNGGILVKDTILR